MSKSKTNSIAVKGTVVAGLSQNQQDFISLTDIARYKAAERTDYLISNWLRNRDSIEQLVVLTNLESLNSVLIRQGLTAPERLRKLNEIAITQLRTLLTVGNVKRLK